MARGFVCPLASQHRHCCVHVNTSPPAVRFAQQYQRSGVQDESTLASKSVSAFLEPTAGLRPRNPTERSATLLHSQPATSRPAPSLFNKEEFRALSKHTATQCYDEKKFSWDSQIYPGRCLLLLHGRAGFILQPTTREQCWRFSTSVCISPAIVSFFHVCLMTQTPAFLMLVGRGSDLCLLKT